LALVFFENKSFVSINEKDWFNYVFHLVSTKYIAASTQRQIVGSGLRIGELLELRLSDIDSERMTVRVNQGKGKKDRLTILSHNVLKVLRKYFVEYKPKDYLFEGQNGGKYSASSSRNVLKQSMKRAKITKPATLHTLRHSFATHLLENGVGIAHIQKLLGHHNIKTTLIYTHIANDSLMTIKSPLD
jgi:integrase/recombinase XerD